MFRRDGIVFRVLVKLSAGFLVMVYFSLCGSVVVILNLPLPELLKGLLRFVSGVVEAELCHTLASPPGQLSISVPPPCASPSNRPRVKITPVTLTQSLPSSGRLFLTWLSVEGCFTPWPVGSMVQIV